jgi:hypothetical protein
MPVDHEEIVLGNVGARLLAVDFFFARPWVESYFTRYARLSAGTRSLTATTSISLPRRPWSQIARKTRRPMRPKPLMPILIMSVFDTTSWVTEKARQ